MTDRDLISEFRTEDTVRDEDRVRDEDKDRVRTEDTAESLKSDRLKKVMLSITTVRSC